MLEMVKRRCGIADTVGIYDEDIKAYIEDALEDMKASGVPPDLLNQEDLNPQVLTAITFYVKAYLGNDRTDTERYLSLYRNKVFRLTLEGGV